MLAQGNKYYVPEQSRLPFVGAVSLFFVGTGTVQLIQGHGLGRYLFFFGALLLASVMFCWFRAVIRY